MIITPNSKNIPLATRPVVFLAGPVQGAPDWQLELAELLIKLNPEITVATPRVPKSLDDDFDYRNQVDWEKRHLIAASRNGVIVFWWSAQDHLIEYEKGRPYAQTTRFEFGRAFGWKDKEPSTKIVVGIDPNYTLNGGGSERYIRAICDEYRMPIASSLKELSILIADCI